jgi:hypothetical protein
MKKTGLFLFSVIASLAFTSCSNNDEVAFSNDAKAVTVDTKSNDPYESFFKYNALLCGPREKVDGYTDTSAKTIYMVSYDEASLKDSYVFNGVDYTDNGQNNDRLAGDGIYTSAKLYDNPTNVADEEFHVIAGDDFFDRDQLTQDLAAGKKPKILPVPHGRTRTRFHCTAKTTYAGESFLGFSCASGCIEINCEGEFWFDNTVEW